MTTPRARTIHRTRSWPKGEFIGHRHFPPAGRTGNENHRPAGPPAQRRDGAALDPPRAGNSRDWATQAQLLTFRPGGRLAPLCDGAAPRPPALRHGDRLARTRPHQGGPRRLPRHRPLHGKDRQLLRGADPAPCLEPRASDPGRRDAPGRRGPPRILLLLGPEGGAPGHQQPRGGRPPRFAPRPRRARVSVIHNSLVFPEASLGRDDELRARLGAAPGSTVLLSVGMFRPEKNQRALIEIAAGFPPDWNWRLWLAGEGPAKAACEALSARLGLADRVRFLGYQADPAPTTGLPTSPCTHPGRKPSPISSSRPRRTACPPSRAGRSGIEECFVPGRTGLDAGAGGRQRFRRRPRPADVRLGRGTARAGSEAREFARGLVRPQAAGRRPTSTF